MLDVNVVYLRALSPEERFVRGGKAQWSVVFVKNSKAVTQQSPELVEELIQRGINPNSARSLIRQTSEEKIREKLTFFDWLRARNDPRVQKSPAGFLYRAITEDFSAPADYPVKELPARKPPVAIRAQVEEEPSQEAANERKRLQDYWAALPIEEQERIERELVLQAPLFMREQYMAGRTERGLLFQTIRQGLIENYVREVLKEA